MSSVVLKKIYYLNYLQRCGIWLLIKKKKNVDLTSFCLLLGFYMNHAFGLVGITASFYCMCSCLIDYNVEDPLCFDSC